LFGVCLSLVVHSEETWQGAVDASEILFGNAATDTLQKLDEDTLLSVFEGVPQVTLSKEELTAGINAIEFLSDKTQIFPSRGEARKMIQAGGVSINKEKIADINATVNAEGLLNNKYLLVQKGKKNYYLIIVE